MCMGAFCVHKPGFLMPGHICCCAVELIRGALTIGCVDIAAEGSCGEDADICNACDKNWSIADICAGVIVLGEVWGLIPDVDTVFGGDDEDNSMELEAVVAPVEVVGETYQCWSGSHTRSAVCGVEEAIN